MENSLRIFVMLLLVTYIGIANSHYAYSQASIGIIAKATPRAISVVAKALRGAGKEADELGPAVGLGKEADELGPAVGLGKEADELGPAVRLGKEADDAAEYIVKLADFIGPDVHLITILEEVGYLPIARNAWNAFPTVRKVETVYRAAENANPGGGNDLLLHVVHKLANMYEGVRHDNALKWFVAPIIR